MRINPGGTLALEDIVGRDALVGQIFETLETQSLLLVAERRMGKTHVLDKLKAQSLPGWTMLKRDVEGVRGAAEFVQLVMADLHPLLSRGKRFRDWLNHIGTDAAGMQIGPVKLPNFAPAHWKQVLVDTLSHLTDAQDAARVVFLWDELPMMLQNLSKSAPQDAMELLDVLRSIRQENPKVRMVFTGSIGLHHVVRHLRHQGYVNAPVNDMAVVDVPPLTPEDATALALRLFKDNGIASEGEPVAEVLAREVDHIPFYIHHVLRTLRTRASGNAKPVTAEDVRRAVADAIGSPIDPWHLMHYLERTRDYYGEDRAACHALIDAIAAAGEPVSVQTALNSAKGVVPQLDREQGLELLQLLERDYYVVRDSERGELHCKFSIVGRWWCLQRGLTIHRKAAT